jgi:RimJ/RimL family protein N-acetyltransferase
VTEIIPCSTPSSSVTIRNRCDHALNDGSDAREVGIRVLTASTLSDNVPALALLRRFGFRPRRQCRGEVDFELRLEPHNGRADLE